LIEPLISEKQLQVRTKPKIEIIGTYDVSSYGLFARVHPQEFKRVISNLIDNGVEALGSSGQVLVRVSADAVGVRIDVNDNGKGIPPELLENLGQYGETHGKPGGLGLGLYHARQAVARWKGHIEINSNVRLGTRISLHLPKTNAPPWFVPSIRLRSGMPVVIVDDDPTIHDVWKNRFASFTSPQQQISIYGAANPLELETWIQSNPSQAPDATYLCDFEFSGLMETGPDLIRRLNISKQSILVTNHFSEDSDLPADLANLKVVPKAMIALVPIHVGVVS
jgi:hypothetical protein